MHLNWHSVLCRSGFLVAAVIHFSTPLWNLIILWFVITIIEFVIQNCFQYFTANCCNAWRRSVGLTFIGSVLSSLYFTVRTEGWWWNESEEMGVLFDPEVRKILQNKVTEIRILLVQRSNLNLCGVEPSITYWCPFTRINTCSLTVAMLPLWRKSSIEPKSVEIQQ